MNQTAVFLGLLCAVALGHWIAEDVLSKARPVAIASDLQLWMRGAVVLGGVWLAVWSLLLLVGGTTQGYPQ